MQNITSNTANNGMGGPDTVLIQAEGKTGDQTDRDIGFAKSLHGVQKGDSPEVNKAAVYDGRTGWKPLGGSDDKGRAMAPGAC